MKADASEESISYASKLKLDNGWSSSSSRGKAPVDKLVVVNAAINEQTEREKRKKNLIVFGLPESSKVDIEEKKNEDKSKIEKLFHDLGALANPVHQRRFKSNNGKPGPILVVLNEMSERNSILAKAKELRNKLDYVDVYISPDLTEAERLQDFKLRKKRD